MVLLLGSFSGSFILYCLQRLEGKHQGGSGLGSSTRLSLKCLEAESFLQAFEKRPDGASQYPYHVCIVIHVSGHLLDQSMSVWSNYFMPGNVQEVKAVKTAVGVAQDNVCQSQYLR